MTREQALEAFNAAREAANDARWQELNRVELGARAALPRIAQIESTGGHGG